MSEEPRRRRQRQTGEQPVDNGQIPVQYQPAVSSPRPAPRPRNRLTCKRCGGNNISVQTVSGIYKKHHGIIWWLLVSWWIWIVWLLAFIPMLIIKVVWGNKYKTKISREAVCQDCGYHWKVK